MTEFRYADISQALPNLMEKVLENGEEIGSRNGRVLEILYPHIVLTEPWRREITTPMRNASLPAQIAETMWVLDGRNDTEWLKHYLPRAEEFSDDGHTWRGAYGKRLRAWPRTDAADVIDQLAWVVDLLKKDRSSRRAVIAIYDPNRDSKDGKDIPCNNWLHFLSRDGYLHLHVTIRSNDLMWGWSGINAFEWSALQEIVAGLLGVMIGELHFSISSLHLYDRHWKKARNIAEHGDVTNTFTDESPRFDAKMLGRDLDNFDKWVSHWFTIEEKLRNSKELYPDTWELVRDFPEPMLRSWLMVIAWHWFGDAGALETLKGTPLYAAALLSPAYSAAVDRPLAATDGEEPLVQISDEFIGFVSKLHAEKHAVYGDSWKRRGELGILGNIARKVDRLGEAGAGDTSADTALDELVYLLKYRLWLTDELGAELPVVNFNTSMLDGPLSDMPQYVDALLLGLKGLPPMRAELPERISRTRDIFGQLEEIVQATPGGSARDARLVLVDSLTTHAAVIAQYLWGLEQHPEGAAMDRFLNA